MFVAGSAGSGYCLRSARVRGKMQVVARGLGVEVCWIAAAGMDRHGPVCSPSSWGWQEEQI
eukprot:scaffold37172_cov36-Attheya_sp.AAC.1